MPSQLQLSICIPTYNRAKFLRECLESIVSQTDDPRVNGKVEIVISDNASTDETEEVVKSFQKRSQAISYFKNQTNLGFDRNLLNAISHAKGNYCLTLGDDDALFNDSLAKLLQKLNTYKDPYIQVNCWGYDNKLKYPVRSFPNRAIKNDVVFDTLSDFVRSIDNYHDLVGIFGGMSTQVFKTSFWTDFPEKEKYVGSNVIHLFILLTIFKDQPFTLLSLPVVKTRADNIRWDTYPGLETRIGRANATLETAMWISNQYNLNLSKNRVKLIMAARLLMNALKDSVKIILRFVGLRK